ncbi:MAG: stage 0 sporulation family protein [Anaerolineales bacterium]|nr:stage 0 sporulation family protein [Anaerolineales bacterium]
MAEMTVDQDAALATIGRAIIGVRFMRVGKLYHFDASGFAELRPGDRVIVETTRGRQLGEVVSLVPPAKQAPPQGGYKAIEGVATARDLALEQMWRQHETEAMINCRERAQQLNLENVKVVKAEYSYDGTRLTFLISGPDDGSGRLDTRSLRDDMQQVYPSQQVALRQIGPRDVAKLLGGMGACGLETRCCAMFLTEFSPVSIKMAKEQGLSLNPEEITGMCGRLRCCLVYEYEQYVAARKTLPKRGKQVVTPKGPGKVVDVNPMKEAVFVAVSDGEASRVYEFVKDDLQPADELEALKQKAASPCDRHESGGCDCGRSKKKAH